MRIDTSPLVRASDIEIATHLTIFFALILPAFALGGLVSLLKWAVWSGVADVAPVVNYLFPDALPTRQQLLFEGRITQTVWILVAIAVIVFFVHYLREIQRQRTGVLTSRAGPRRYRVLPDNLQAKLATYVGSRWQTVASGAPAPPILSFPATGIKACTVANGGTPAVAVSTSFLQRFIDSGASDPILGVIIFHEFAHLVRRDFMRLTQLTALLKTLRQALLGLIVIVLVTNGAWEVLDGFRLLRSTDTSDASLGARLLDVVRTGSFAYLLLVIVGRYASLITMLTELRADVLGAQWFGDVEHFVDTVCAEGQTRHSSHWQRWHTLFGIRVTHLMPVERVRLLTKQDRLLTPKIRYFSYSLALPVLLMINGFVAFGDFQWIPQMILFAVVSAFNALVVVMVMNAAPVRGSISPRRLGLLSVAVSVVNGFLLTNVYGVMMRSGELLTAMFDQNFQESPTAVADRAISLAKALLEPFRWDLAFWVLGAASILALIWRLAKGAQFPNRSLVIVSVSVVIGTFLAFAGSVHAPPNFLRRALQAAGVSNVFSEFAVPACGILFGTVTIICLRAWKFSCSFVRRASG